MKFRYKYGDNVSKEELFVLLDKMMQFKGDKFPAKNVFHFDLRNYEKEDLSLENTISVTARNYEDELIGYLRILTDHAYIYYILDVMVNPKYRNNGIGAELVSLAVNRCKDQGFIKIFLTAIPGTEKFYEKFGFKESMSPVLTIRGEDY